MYGVVTFCGKTFNLEVFGEYLSCHSPPFDSECLLDYLNNLGIDQHSDARAASTFCNHFIPCLVFPVKNFI